ncbi:FAD-dependent pyridine nucleotide-disulphide oxidoreductase [Modestobacter italicus]|uniref:FAD-dependent pyridine nucleotide-disulphide oxidoreductase n=1 Tax=Modestobacter italicus (strain DSM 44449 / CECT 9708 / BC 501) TaxID=2732864 RepID=I4EYF3_MODI5|nr:FAD-dependent oxidoreductase [Modestobacter marinus]CCH88416.1 FAD-dependent pyridine nucleotide-disulphide oxidoreductase [Modestobacter marinus]
MSRRDVVVVGGSIAALTAVEVLRMEDFDGRITVLSEEDVPPYTRVPLSKGVLAGTESIDDIVLAPLADDVDLRLRTAATALDLDTKTVHTPSGPVHYDGLVIATGGRARRLGTPDQQERVLRTHGDCARLRDALAAASSVLVVGGGFLGMEVASTARALGKEVTVVDLALPLDRLLGTVVGGYVRSVATQAGVRIVVTDGGVRLQGAPTPTGVQLVDGTRLEADLVVSAVGDVPNVEWLAGSGVAVRGGLVVDHRCRVAPDVVAAGDVTVTSVGDGQLTRSPQWTNAVEQARTAVQALLHGDAAAPYRPSRYCWTEQFGLDVKMVGEPDAQGGPAVLDGALDSGSALLAWPDAGTPRTVIAVNHRTPPAKLKRLLRPAQGALLC